MGNGELRSNEKHRGVRSKIQNETYVEKYKSLGNKISASIIVQYVGNLKIVIIYFIYYILITENTL